MIIFTRCLSYAQFNKPIKRVFETGFRDTLRIFAQGGTGGNGFPKFGGVGGQGGDVIAVATESITLDEVKKRNRNGRYIAADGQNSSKNFILGPAGESIRIEVPVGTSAFTDEGKKIGEVNKAGEQITLVKGGSGGHRNNGYIGRKGQSFPIKFDFKLIADIGLVGYPNVGKSTILKAISRAKPEITRHPFTTVKPIMGIMKYEDERQITVTDLPGLIEGAHKNQGLGNQFLKHLERTKLLLFVVDIKGFSLNVQFPHRSCLETILILNKELELYNADLLKKPAVVILNKMDNENATEMFENIREHICNISGTLDQYPQNIRPTNVIRFEEILPISARNKEDIFLVKAKLRRVLDIQADNQKKNETAENIKFIRDIKKSIREFGPRLV